MEVSPESVLCGGGILPFFIDDGAPCFILGKEKYTPSWRGGSSKWSAFEGGRKGNETPEQNAVREFMEESIESLVHGAHTRVLEQELLRRDYALRITIQMQTHAHVLPRSHVTYVKQFRCNRAVVDAFTRRRAFLLEADATCKTHREARAQVAPCYPFHMAGDVIWRDNCRYMVERVLDVAEIERAGSGDSVWLRVSLQLASPYHCVTVCASHQMGERGRAYLRWFRHQVRIDALIVDAHRMHIEHALHIRRTGECMVHAHVKPDYVEKSEVRVWTLAELSSVVASGGGYDGHVFRPYFMPVLEQTVKAFSGEYEGTRDVITEADLACAQRGQINVP